MVKCMDKSFFFYDLETSGVNPRSSRIMQFAGRRTDMDLNPIGEPVNILIRLSEDILPDPDAVLVTGITPQKTITEGITEAEFVELFEEINQSGTIFVGFNSVRFDDEFMRFLFWRNFHDPYEWHWKNSCSRWDILDVSRMARALRPDGIKWPVDSEGKPTNRLEYLSAVNKLDHASAHDALSDVDATIALARLIKNKQPKLFDYLLNMRGKNAVGEFLSQNEVFLYTSGKYPGEFEKTAIVTVLADHPQGRGKLVYDLRHDPAQYTGLSPEKLAELWRWKKDSGEPRLPVKSLQPNRCPAIAPLSVLDRPSTKRLKINMNEIEANLAKLKDAETFAGNVLKALDILNNNRQQTALISAVSEVDAQLYDSFLGDGDRRLLLEIRSSTVQELSGFALKVHDDRLKNLLPLYKARNFPKHLSEEERLAWEEFCKHALLASGAQSRIAKFSQRLEDLSQDKLGVLTDKKRYLLEELRLYAESILP
ncbi:exodeoxyribonuclease I [Candidatus Parcubacteria bacterium]|nr:exodeoxyribonuclease I [Candidatus Parcubacteria bacterium]